MFPVLLLCVAALPPNLLVLDVSQNKEMTGPLPSPLPQSMVFLGATGASLTGDLPDLPQESSIVRVLLGANQLEGGCVWGRGGGRGGGPPAAGKWACRLMDQHTLPPLPGNWHL